MAISISRLLGMFGNEAEAAVAPKAKAAPAAAPRAPRPRLVTSNPPVADGDYRAVSIVSGNVCCELAARYKDKRFLVAEAPQLPLPGCTSKGQCACSYRKHADRRSGEDRRLGLPGEKSLWYHGIERRLPNGRRKTD